MTRTAAPLAGCAPLAGWAPWTRWGALLATLVLTLWTTPVLRAQLAQDTWREVTPPAGSARLVAAGGRTQAGAAVVGAIDRNGVVYRRDTVSGAWQSVGSNMARLAIDAAANFWAIDNQGILQRLEGSAWRGVGVGAVALASTPSGSIVVATNAGSLAEYDPAQSRWTPLAGSGVQVAVDTRGLVWAVNANGGIARRLGDAWIGVPGRARDIAADALGNVVIADPEGRVFEWSENELRWNEIAGATRTQSLALAAGQIWRTDTDGKLHARGIRYSGPPVATLPVDPALRTRNLTGTPDSAIIPDLSPPDFVLVASATTLADLSIGYDGSVYGTTTTGGILRWSNAQRRFNSFPGTLAKIEINEAGLPLGVNGSRALLRHDGAAWRKLAAQHDLVNVSNAGNAIALAVSAQGDLYRLDVRGESLTAARLAGNVEQVAAAPDGGFWYRNTAGLLFQCDKAAQCERRSLATADLAVGPGGTLFAVDTSGNLHRFRPIAGGVNGGNFEILRRASSSASAARVAVGPNDRPWIIEKNGNVLAARLFERDESNDLALARASESTANVTQPEITANTGSGVLAFSFLPVDVPTAAGAFGDIGAGLNDVTVGLDDQIIVTGFDPANFTPCATRTSGWKGRNWIYSPAQRRFVHLDYLKRVQMQVAIAARSLTNGNAPPALAGAPSVPALYTITRACERYYNNEYHANTFNNLTADFYDKGGLDFGQSLDRTSAVTANTRDLTTVLDMDITLDNWVLTIFPQRKINFIGIGPNDPLNPAGPFPNRADQKFARIGAGATRDVIWATSFENDVYEYVRATDRYEKRNVLDADKAQDIGVGKDGSVFIVDLSGRLKKWDAAQKTFVYAGLSGVTRVAVTSKGKPVAANFPASQRVFIAQ